MKILKTNILLLVLLSLSNCQREFGPVSAEHLYFWDSKEDKNIFFASSSFDKNFDPTTQSLVQYARLDDVTFFAALDIRVFKNTPKNIIKKMGFGLLNGEGCEFTGSLDTEKNRDNIEYYPISVIANDSGVRLAQRLYFRQDTPTDPIDVLAIDIDNNTTDFQHTFVSPPEYAFVPERNNDGKPL